MSNQADDTRRKASEAAKALGRLGGLKGGPAPKAALTPEQRSAAARKAVLARWAKKAMAQASTGDFGARALLDWREDMHQRRKSLTAFADFSTSQTPGDDFITASGRFMILHFDLMTLSRVGKLDRRDTYDAIQGLIGKNHGFRLSESVYLVPLAPKGTSLHCAVQFWNLLGDRLKGLLAEGDSFYLHYGTSLRDRMGGIGYLVGDDLTLQEARVV